MRGARSNERELRRPERPGLKAATRGGIRRLALACVLGASLLSALALALPGEAAGARAPTWTDVSFPSGQTALDVAEDSRGGVWATTLEASETFGHVMVLHDGASAWEDACEGLDWDADPWSDGLLAVDDKLFLTTTSGTCYARSVDDPSWHVVQTPLSLTDLTGWDGYAWAGAGYLGVARLDPATEAVETVLDGLTVVMDNPEAARTYRNPRGNDGYLYVGSTVSPALAASEDFEGVSVYRLARGTSTWEDTGLDVTPRAGDLGSSADGPGGADWGVWNVVPADGYVFAQVLSQGAGSNIRCFLYDEETGTWADLEMPDTEGGWWLLASGEPCFVRDGDFYFPTGFVTDGVVCDVLDPGSGGWRQGVTVKGTTWEPLVSTTQMVGDELVVAYVEGSEAGGAETSFVEAVPLPTEISSDPGVIGTNVGLAVLFALVFGFTSMLFNNALRVNYVRMARAFAPLGRAANAVQRGVWRLLRKLGSGLRTLLFRSRGSQRTGSRLPHLGRRWMERLAVVLVAALVYAFLDPTFGFSGHGANIFFSLAISIALVTFAYEGVQALISAWGYQIPAGVRLFPAAIGVAVVCVMLSRLTGFVPGYLYGFVGGMAFLTAWRPDERREARMVLTGSLCLLILSLGAWFLTLAVADAAASGSAGASFLQSICTAVFVAGLEGLLFGLLPLGITDGGTLFRWNKVVWGGMFGVVLFLFWHVLLNKDSKYGQAFAQTNTKVLLIVLAFWTVVTVGIYLVFRKPRPVAPYAQMPYPWPAPPGTPPPPPPWAPAGQAPVPQAAPPYVAPLQAAPPPLPQQPRPEPGDRQPPLPQQPPQ